jgi:peptide chain release factor 2
MRERTNLENAIGAYKRVVQELEDTVELIELSEMEEDEDMLGEAEIALNELQVEVDKRRLESMLSGEVDSNDCYLEIHAGAGGTESQDWTQILLRMYMRWAEKNGNKVKILEESAGEEAGIKSVTIEISGENVLSGFHRSILMPAVIQAFHPSVFFL